MSANTPVTPSLPPVLVLGIGNPSRGDDALGALFIERVNELFSAEIAAGQIECITDFQLQIEHALDLLGRERVVFVDASINVDAPFAFTKVTTRGAPSYTTHAMSPEQVVDTCRDVLGEPPESWVLAIRGEHFELGEPLSPRASTHLSEALAFFVEHLRSG